MVRERRKMIGERTLEIDGQEWGFLIGKVNTVIVPPKGRKVTVPHTELTGRTKEQIQMGRLKKTPDGTITPGDVRRYIDGNLVEA